MGGPEDARVAEGALRDLAAEKADRLARGVIGGEVEQQGWIALEPPRRQQREGVQVIARVRRIGDGPPLLELEDERQEEVAECGDIGERGAADGGCHHATRRTLNHAAAAAHCGAMFTGLPES